MRLDFYKSFLLPIKQIDGIPKASNLPPADKPSTSKAAVSNQLDALMEDISDVELGESTYDKSF